MNKEYKISHSDEVLIGLVEARPFIYDISVAGYRDVTKKEDAWSQIAELCGFENAKAARARFKALRNQYGRALNRPKNFPEHPIMKLLGFLGNVKTGRRRKSDREKEAEGELTVKRIKSEPIASPDSVEMSEEYDEEPFATAIEENVVDSNISTWKFSNESVDSAFVDYCAARIRDLLEKADAVTKIEIRRAITKFLDQEEDVLCIRTN